MLLDRVHINLELPMCSVKTSILTWEHLLFGNVITTSDRPVMFDICQLWQHIRNLVFNIVTGWYDKQSILTATERDPESTDINVQSKYCYLY